MDLSATGARRLLLFLKVNKVVRLSSSKPQSGKGLGRLSSLRSRWFLPQITVDPPSDHGTSLPQITVAAVIVTPRADGRFHPGERLLESWSVVSEDEDRSGRRSGVPIRPDYRPLLRDGPPGAGRAGRCSVSPSIGRRHFLRWSSCSCQTRSRAILWPAVNPPVICRSSFRRRYFAARRS
jgi:hypothetical protein